MVDCDLFTNFNRQISIYSDHLLLDYKKCDYNIKMAFPYNGCERVAKEQKPYGLIKKVKIQAVYGIVEMEVNSYLLAVTKASIIGQIYHRKIFQVQKMDFFCLSEKQSDKDKKYIKGLDLMFSNKCWYFSDDYDLTNSLQQFIKSNFSLRNKRMQYMFNADWIDQFLKLKAYEWITGFISGFVSTAYTNVTPSNSCDIAIITRRDRRRQGKRWITRGCDFDGNSVNTAQTQMVFLIQQQGKQNLFSYVQLRGSMPFIWQQRPDLKWSPKVVIHPSDKLNSETIRKNYADIKRGYQSCYMINLIDKKGSQGRLGEYFQKMHRTTDQDTFSLIWFDFHAECKKMKYENLSKLIEMVKNQLENYGYFHVQLTKGDSQRVVKKNTQKGIFRTNCMDCLDRTNVVQSVFARQILIEWLVKSNNFSKGRDIKAFEMLPENLQVDFRKQWTMNADVVSLLYSGTPAMKTDFTATGKRTTRGAINDAYFGVKRYFLGNFYDARDQDYIDFSLAKIKPRQNSSQSIKHPICNSMYLLLLLLVVAFYLMGGLVDAFVDNSLLTVPSKILAGLVGMGLTLFLARQMKGLFVRQPIRSETL